MTADANANRRTADGRGASGALAMAAVVLAPLPLAGALGNAAMTGYDGLWTGLGLALGLTLAGMLLAAPLQRSRAATPIAFLAERFGRPTAVTAAAISSVALVLLLAGQLASLGPVAAMLLGDLPAGGAVGAAAVVAVAFLAAAPSDGRAARLVVAIAAAVAIVAFLVAAIALAVAAGAPVPVAYGGLLRETARLEVALLGQKLADALTLKAHATPYVTLDATSFFGALIGAAGGTAVLAALAQRLAGPRHADGARSTMAWSLVLLLPVLVLMPAMAAAIKGALYQMIAKPQPVAELPGWLLDLSRDHFAGICGRYPADAASAVAACKTAAGNKGLLRLQDLGMDGAVTWLAGGRITGLPAPLALLPAVSALAAALAAAVAAVALLRSLPARQAGGWVAAIAGAAAAAALAVLAPEEAKALSWWVLPLAAASLMPVFVLALWWRRATAAGALAGLLAGAGLTLYYLVGTRYFPVGFYDLWQSLSPAGVGAERKLVALREAWAAADDAHKAAAWQALVAQARGMASWWGVRPPTAALFGLPAALIAAVVGSLLTRRQDGAALDVADRAHDVGAA